MSAELLILVDNEAGEPSLRSEHGLSILLEGAGRRVMFDAAASPEVLEHNAEALGVDLSRIDALVVSHGHFDHTGGLSAVTRRADALDIYAHPSAFSRRWSDRSGEPLVDISCPHSLQKLCDGGAVFHAVNAPQRLEDWLVISGPIGGPRYGPDTFVVRKRDEIVRDAFEDEIFLLVRGRDGWVVVTGCCHRGLKNTLRTARFLARGEGVTSIIGGLHLGGADERELGATVELLREAGSPHLHICHCTGAAATKYLDEHLPDRVHAVTAGCRIEL